jgi:hypothetical protein
MVINGQGKPRLIVLNSVNPNMTDPAAVIDLPYCNKLTETFTPVVIIHKVQGGKLALECGHDYSCKLDYSDLIDGQDLLNLQPALTFSTPSGTNLGTQLVLIPRLDCFGRNFNVCLADEINLSTVFANGSNAGHSDLILTFTGLDRLGTVPMKRSGFWSNYGGRTRVNDVLWKGLGYGFNAGFIPTGPA